MDIKTFVNVASSLPSDVSILVRGPHGIGKSQIFRQVAAAIDLEDGSTGIDLIDRRLAQMTEGDIIGLPELVDGVTRFAPVDWLLRACREPVALFLDEVNRATPEVMQCAFQLVLDRELNGHKLHPETRIFCAVNASADYQVNEMDPALLDRFWVVDLEPTDKDWIEWAKAAGIDEVVVDFISHHPAHLRHVGQIEPGKVYPSPRSWERIDTSLKSAGMTPSSICGRNTPSGFYAMSLGFVGAEAAITFVDFVKNYDLQISAEDVIDRYEEFSEKISDLSNDKVNSIIDKISEHCKNNEWTAEQCKRISVFAKTLPGEMLVSLWNNVMDSGEVNNITRLHKFLGQAVLEAVTVARNLQ
tara:strand:+ start:1843 stop:2916 length:1074 start_codon:yes stop_codon:yes gene_type:complete